jgi:hypothetical protein
MARIWRSVGFETLRYWVDTITDEASDQLSEWEMNFLVDISIRVCNRIPLTQPQEEKLEQIYAKYTK